VRVIINPRIGQCRRVLAEVSTTVHAVTVLAFVELLIRWVPLPRLSHLLGVRLNFDPAPSNVEQVHVTELPARVRRQIRCTARVTSVWPFSEGPCLRRSLVIGHLLRRRDVTVRLGIAGAGDAILAHAWVEVADRPLEDVAGFSALEHARVEAT
jgi:hypothetical protein